MNKARKLSASEISERLGALEGWSVDNDKLHKELVFPTFGEAIGFMTSAAFHAERLDHHPEWSNVYNRVVICLTTHDCNGISELDFELASCIDKLT